MFRRSLGSPALFAVLYSGVASSIYFALGVVSNHALGLTPVVFLGAGFFFLLTLMTYIEGATLHPERGGSTNFARYAFNELVSFVAGWAVLLDYVILIAITAFTATNYLGTFWSPLGEGAVEALLAIAIIAVVAVLNVRGLSAARFQSIARLAVMDLVLQVVVIVLGMALVFDASALVDPIDLGRAPGWSDLLFAFTIATVAFIGVESAAGLAREVAVDARSLKRLIGAGTAATMTTYVGMALVALTALPVRGGRTELGSRSGEEAPVVAVVNAYPHRGPADALHYVVAGTASIVLITACASAMLGLSRLAYSLATNRQIPSAVGRLHPTRSTPYVIIVIAAVLAAALTLTADIEFLVGIYAFGALLAFTIAHVSITVLRYREPDGERPFRVPLSVRVGGGSLPLPAVFGAVASAFAWASVVVTHGGARIVGIAWMVAGLALYVIYRRAGEKPLLARVLIPEAALRAEPPEVEYGSILVPIFGRPLDDDIVQTAGRLAGDDRLDEGEGGAVIEALWVFEIPMSLPIDAAVPDAQLKRARAALARAKAVGEEYEGVEVATATVRARRTGQAIVEEARRRGVEAIVLAAEEPSRIRGGALLGGAGAPLENFVGDVTKYVIDKAPCRVVLTAPPADVVPTPPAGGDPAASADGGAAAGAGGSGM